MNYIDPTGEFWEEIWEFLKAAVGEAGNNIQQLTPAYAACGGTALSDGPMPFGDILALAGVAFLTAGAIGYGVYQAAQSSSINNASPGSSTSPTTSSQSMQRSYAGGLGAIAGSFKDFECKEAAAEMARYLRKNKQHGEIITITYVESKGYIWSDIRAAVISTNGVHVGVKYNGFVYCNIHPYGLPEYVWLNDFHATGTRVIQRIPI